MAIGRDDELKIVLKQDCKSIGYMIALDGTLFWGEIYGYSNYYYDTDIHSSAFDY